MILLLLIQFGRKSLLLICGMCLSVISVSVATVIVAFDLDDPSEEGFNHEQIVAGYFIVALIILFMCAFVVSYG